MMVKALLSIADAALQGLALTMLLAYTGWVAAIVLGMIGAWSIHWATETFPGLMP